ncbi:hypothetical protein BBJ28_00001886 [Nothophytophthora sp. Chile5]|nr:hypothetical protein BBJ28_00001886 [Nothophytophthora sp. Chile5]
MPASDGTIAFRARSKSKSRARSVTRRTAGQEFIPLGSNRASSVSTLNTNKASYYRPPVAELTRAPTLQTASALARARSRSVEVPIQASRSSRWSGAAQQQQQQATGHRGPSPVSMRTRSKSVTRVDHDTAAAIRRSKRERSKSAARRSGGQPLQARRRTPSPEPPAPTRKSRSTGNAEARSGKKRGRSKSKPRGRERERSVSRGRRSRHSRAASESSSDDEEEEREKVTASRSSRRSSRSGSNLQEIEDAMAATERELAPKKKELAELREELAELKQRVETKELEVYDLQVDLDALGKRRERRLPSHSNREDKAPSRRSKSKGKSQPRERRRSSSRPRASKRPCIVDEDDEGSDDEVVIMDPADVKQELANAAAAAKSAVVPVEETMPDHFWGRSDVPKLLVNHRFHAIPDGSIRKGRHLAFNPIQPSIFATSADEGGLILWSYQRQDQEIAKVVSLVPSSFRRDSPCAEGIAWSPDGNRLAMAFRDPLDGKGEFCIVQLHQLKLEDSDTPQPIPRDRLTSKSTTLHSRGISAIDWLPTGYGADTTSRQLVTTGASDHAVVLWEEHEDLQNGGMDLKWRVLHRDHRSEVRSLCVHSKRNCLYTGGLDGLVIQYDLNRSHAHIVIERRKPTISKINSVLEHPHNPNVLLVSCVEQTRHSILLHDLRQRYREDEMTLTWEGGAMSQYVVPRWSPAGYHVSCGSKSGVVNIWDVRMRGENYPKVLPQQSLHVHRKCLE